MHTIRPLPRPARHRLARHYLEMALAMLVGMSLLGPLEPWLLGAGWVDLRAAPEFDALVMAINMTVAMVAWRLRRQHIGLLTGAFLTSGQVLMFLAMAAVMLRHEEYASPTHPRGARLEASAPVHGEYRCDDEVSTADADFSYV